MDAMAGVPGLLHEREGSVGEKMGSLEAHLRCTMLGALSCVGSSE